MNIFRFLGDLSHIVSFLVLLHKIIKGKSSAGISLRTQELYAGVLRRAPPGALWAFACGTRTPAKAGATCQAVLEFTASGGLCTEHRVGGVVDLRGAVLALRSGLLQPVH